MRSTSLTSLTKTMPSPRLPVCATVAMSIGDHVRVAVVANDDEDLAIQIRQAVFVVGVVPALRRPWPWPCAS